MASTQSSALFGQRRPPVTNGNPLSRPPTEKTTSILNSLARQNPSTSSSASSVLAQAKAPASTQAPKPVTTSAPVSKEPPRAPAASHPALKPAAPKVSASHAEKPVDVYKLVDTQASEARDDYDEDNHGGSRRFREGRDAEESSDDANSIINDEPVRDGEDPWTSSDGEGGQDGDDADDADDDKMTREIRRAEAEETSDEGPVAPRKRKVAKRIAHHSDEEEVQEKPQDQDPPQADAADEDGGEEQSTRDEVVERAPPPATSSSGPAKVAAPAKAPRKRQPADPNAPKRPRGAPKSSSASTKVQAVISFPSVEPIAHAASAEVQAPVPAPENHGVQIQAVGSPAQVPISYWRELLRIVRLPGQVVQRFSVSEKGYEIDLIQPPASN